MTRHDNPSPYAQVPPQQGRPARATRPQHQDPAEHFGHAEPELTGWPQPGPPPRQQPPQQPGPHHRAAQPGYPDLGFPEPDAGATQDPYRALRPDGYGNTQPPQGSAAESHGFAGYAAPQSSGQGYPAARPAPYVPSLHQQATAHQPTYDPYQQPQHESFAPQGQGPHDADYALPFGSPASGPQGYASTPHGYGAQEQDYSLPPASPASPPSLDGGYLSPPQPGGVFGRAERQAEEYPADQWGAPGGHGHGGHDFALDPHGYPAPDAYEDSAGHGEPGQWSTDPYGDPQSGEAEFAHGTYQAVHQGQNGGQHGAFDQSYADDDAIYDDEPRRAGWKKAALVMACTVLFGGGLVYGFSGLIGSGTSEPPPLVKGAEGPSKVKPSEPGGKRFDHTDSKIMGRLGEGAATSDPSGIRKVPVVSVGRDGQIQPPSSEQETQAIVSVPGLTVIDGLGGPSGPGGTAAAPAGGPAADAAGGPPSPDRRAAAIPPKTEMVTGAGKAPAAQKQATPAKSAAAPSAQTPTKTAAADPKPAATGPRATGAGYVAVLASVPASASSRIDALTQFADMQQKYGAILSNKTPDIQEANLGAKGTYHRLLVGPPGSRDAANSVCNQLKAQGYSGCWITAY